MSTTVRRTNHPIAGEEALAELRRPLRDAAGELVADPRAFRLAWTPSYVVVGAYRLMTDWSLFWAVWKKCKHGTLRGLAVGSAWVFLSWKAQLGFVRRFGQYLPFVKKYFVQGEHVVLGVNISVATYATTFILSAQFYFLLKFFLSRNLRIAKERAWSQTLKSRGKPDSFWGPYIEEWETPPIDKAQRTKKRLAWTKYALGFAGRFVLNKFILFPLQFIPLVGIVATSVVKALGTARLLHQPYYASKKMTEDQIDVFIEERKWDYFAFGFTAALCESLPFIGMLFSVSNRVASAMWAHDLEKRQEAFRSGELKPQPHSQTSIDLLPGAERLGLGGLGRLDVKSDAVRERVDVREIVGGWTDGKKEL